MFLINTIFVLIFIIAALLSICYGHFSDFIWVFLAVLFGFYTSWLLVKYSENVDKQKEIAKLSVTKLDILRYLENEIESNIRYMEEFDEKFNKAKENKFKSVKQDYGNVKISSYASDIWNKFLSNFDDLEFIRLIDDEYIKYMAIHKAIEVFWEKVYDLIEKYAIEVSSYDVEVKKVQIRYMIVNTLMQRCIGPDKSSKKCLEAIRRKLETLKVK